MKLFVKRLGLFVLFAALAYVPLLIIVGELVPNALNNGLYKIGAYGHLNTRIKEIPNYSDVDILVLGSSHAYRGFDPRIFQSHGYRLFVFGSSAQTPIQTKYFIDRYIDRLNPKLVLLDVYPGVLGLDGLESTLDVISNDSIDMSTVKMAWKAKSLKAINCLIFGYYRQIFHRNDSFVEKAEKNGDKYVKGGFVEKGFKTYKIPQQEVEKTNWIVDEQQKQALEASVQAIKGRGIPLLLIQVPYTTWNYLPKTNNKEMDEYFMTLAPYVNFNQRVPLNDSLHFYDSHHLNQAGVQIFDAAIIALLKEKMFLGISPK